MTPDTQPGEVNGEEQRIAVQYAVSGDGIPAAELIQQWADKALQERSGSAELTVRVVDEAEITALNRQFRGKDGATNVLSFPYENMPGVTSDLLGDVVVCAPVVANESVAQHKTLEAHWAHIVVHGVLHLLGHDHTHDDEAHKMEACETGLLAGLGYPDPYE
jgi:probable rRNA maturation factor